MDVDQAAMEAARQLSREGGKSDGGIKLKIAAEETAWLLNKGVAPTDDKPKYVEEDVSTTVKAILGLEVTSAPLLSNSHSCAIRCRHAAINLLTCTHPLQGYVDSTANAPEVNPQLPGTPFWRGTACLQKNVLLVHIQRYLSYLSFPQ